MAKQKIIQQGAEAVLIKRKISAADLLSSRPRTEISYDSVARNALAGGRDAPSARKSKGSLRSQGNKTPRFVVMKRRVKKGYRIKEMDEKIRKLRTRGEAKLLEKAGKIIPVPKVLKVSEKDKEIDMEFIAGEKLSESLDSMKNWEEVCVAIGENIARLHDEGIIHGDLTTSNMIWVSSGKNSPQLNAAAAVDGARSARELSHRRPGPLGVSVVGARQTRSCARKFLPAKLASRLAGIRPAQPTLNVSSACSPILQFSRATRSPTPKCADVKLSQHPKSLEGVLYFIDFGLGFANGRIEDKAVDLYLIKEALEAKHFLHWEKFFKAVLKGYKVSKNCKETLKRLEKVEKRGRYKQNY